MKAFIDDHRAVYGVEPIYKVLPIAPSTYYLHPARKGNPSLRSKRARRNDDLSARIRRVWEENFQAYGARKVWLQLQRDGQTVARCTVERLMRQNSLKEIVRGRTVKTTLSDLAASCPLDRINRQFTAGSASECLVGGGFYLCFHLARLCLCGVRERCLFPLYRRREGLRFRAYRFCAGCAGANNLCPSTGAGRLDSP